MLIKSGHDSVIEHKSVTFKFVGDRSMSHQLVRHRLASYSQESQRYCDYKNKGYTVICPVKVANVPQGVYEYTNITDLWHVVGDGTQLPKDTQIEVSDEHIIEFMNDILRCFIAYDRYRERGVPAEDARCILPNATKTEVVATYNLRTWRHLFKERALNPHAQWQIKQLMQDCLTILYSEMPAIFSDQYEELEKLNV